MLYPRLAILVCTLLCHAQAWAQATLDPKTYQSASNTYQLAIDPTNREGRGEGIYTLTRNAHPEPLWRGQLPFTLWDAVVADDGAFAGYAYNLGHQGWPRRDETSSIIIAIVNPDGTIRAQHGHERSLPNFRSNPPSPMEPVAEGIILDQPNDRIIVRTAHLSFGRANPHTWWTYRLSTGEQISEFHPETPAAGDGFIKEIDVRLLPGTPLLLTHWYSYRRNGGDAHFALLDPNGRSVWRHVIPGDYDDLEERWNWSNLHNDGAGQVILVDDGFEILSYRHQQRTRFAVARDEHHPVGWSITQTGQAPARIPASREEKVIIQTVELPFLGEITLRAENQTTSEIRNLQKFAIDAEGRFGFIRYPSDPGRSSTFFLLDQGGDILSRIDLRFQDPKILPSIALPQPDEQWLLIDTGLGQRSASVHRLDIETGRLTRIEIDVGGIREAAAFPDGGFVALAGDNWLDARKPTRFSADGKRLWSRPSPGTVQDIAITTDRTIVVLTGIQNNLEFYSEDGDHQETLSIQQLLGRRPNYPSGLKPDLNGGLILHDFHGHPPIFRLNADGALASELSPRWPDDRTFRITGDVQAAPDGSLWTADGQRFLMLADDGIVQRHIGDDPDTTAVSGLRALTLDRRGWIYAIDDATAAVHIFDETGQKQQTFRPEPTDFKTDSGLGHITVAHDGAFYYFPQKTFTSFQGTPHLHVDAQGNRVGLLDPLFDWIREEWYCKPADPGIWAIGYQELRLLDGDRNILKTINRRPNNEWLGITSAAAVAPDGSLAIVTETRDGLMGGPVQLCIYNPDGTPRTMFALDQVRHVRIAFTGRYAVTTHDNLLRLFDVKTGQESRFELPATEEAWWSVHTGPDGSELLVRDNRSTTLLRYGLPE